MKEITDVSTESKGENPDNLIGCYSYYMAWHAELRVRMLWRRLLNDYHISICELNSQIGIWPPFVSNAIL